MLISWVAKIFVCVSVIKIVCETNPGMSGTQETWLEQDKEIPGQKYVCLSFLSPEKVLANKDIYFYSKFLENYEVEYKVQASEKFLMAQIAGVTKAIAKVEDLVANAEHSLKEAQNKVVDLSGAAPPATSPQDEPKKWNFECLEELQNARAALTRGAADDLAAYVKENMRDFKETKIQESFDNFMFKNRKKLEEEFFAKNDFKTTIRGLKVRGVYDTYQEASARAKTLQKIDPYFNVYVGQMGFWLPWDPEPSEVADQEYAEEQLNSLMKNYKQNEQQKEQLYEEDKRQRMAGATGSKPKFGPGSEENKLPVDMFGGGGEADLAIARKKEAAKAMTIDV